MQKMNKETLIEYFIKLLGDNRVLGKFISLEEIRERLNENLEMVTFSPEKGTTEAHYCPKEKKINFDFEKITSKSDFHKLLVHEFLHVLSTSQAQLADTQTQKVGFEIEQTNEKESFYHQLPWRLSRDGTYRIWGKSLNEGITELLTEEILGLDTNLDKGYETEKDVSRVLLGIIGKENILERYFAKIKNNDEINNPITFFFADFLETNYQFTETSEIHTFLEKTLEFSEHLIFMKYNTHGELDETESQRYDIHYKQLAYIIRAFTEIALRTIKPPDVFHRKLEIIQAILQFHSPKLLKITPDLQLVDDISKVIFSKDETSQWDEKISRFTHFLLGLEQEDAQMILKQTLQNSQDNLNLNDILNLTTHTRQNNGYFLDDIFLTHIEQNHITKAKFSKHDMLSIILENDPENLENFYYQKRGPFYQLIYTPLRNDPASSLHLWTEECIYDENGVELDPYEIEENQEFLSATPEMPRRMIDDMSSLDLQLMHETQDAGITISDMQYIAGAMLHEKLQENEIFKERN